VAAQHLARVGKATDGSHLNVWIGGLVNDRKNRVEFASVDGLNARRTISTFSCDIARSVSRLLEHGVFGGRSGTGKVGLSLSRSQSVSIPGDDDAINAQVTRRNSHQ
jgi:hypothetical protein